MTSRPTSVTCSLSSRTLRPGHLARSSDKLTSQCSPMRMSLPSCGEQYQGGKIMEFETLATGYGLIEGPRTDEQNRLYYSDVRGGGVFRRSPDGWIETLIPERKSVGGIALNQGGGLIVTGPTLAHWDEKSGRITD